MEILSVSETHNYTNKTETTKSFKKDAQKSVYLKMWRGLLCVHILLQYILLAQVDFECEVLFWRAKSEPSILNKAKDKFCKSGLIAYRNATYLNKESMHYKTSQFWVRLPVYKFWAVLELWEDKETFPFHQIPTYHMISFLTSSG